MSQYLIIKLGSDNFELRFQIRSTPLAKLWLERMSQRHAWPMDNPDRFYGFGTIQQEQRRAVEMIQQCIITINAHDRIINREFEYTQDCLNYLHNIFERYHGLLDQQTSEYWHSAPDTVRQALANLNLAVHRCETAMFAPSPRFVCTWFGMPKTQQLDINTMQEYGVLDIKFGTVYLNYCEIGKTVEDLSHDNDTYIGDDAFKPFRYYSADFVVSFFEKDLRHKLTSMQQYIAQHQEFFLAHGIENVYNVQAQPLRFPVADLEYTGTQEELISQIRSRQFVREVTINEMLYHTNT
jgi:hypothetical protein